MIFNKIKWAPFALTLFTIPLVSSCSSNDEEEQQEVKRPISVVVSENPMIEEESGSRITRADDPTTTETLTSFKMMYQADAEIKTEYTAEKTGSPANWGLNDNNWPYGVANGTLIDFYAYNAGVFNYNNGSPYVSFSEANNEAKNQVDLLVAKSNTSFNAHGGKVPLTFSHACAAVQFIVFLNSNASETFEITDIKLKNIKNKGDYYYSKEEGKEGEWKDISWSTEWNGEGNASKRYYQLTDGNITPSKTEDKLLPCGWLFLIPQDKSGISLSISYTKGGGKVETKEIALPTSTISEWKAGYSYTERIKIG